ncbi:MAG: diaminopimelate decarboxylase [Lachnospiraceae bacterium]|nr:diaminopimelate decarboxylase [Lachnospiraceae bacterium]
MEKKAFLSREKAEEIAAKFPTPFHIYDEEGIRKNAERVKEAFSWNRGFKEYFAVKATPNPFILKLLKECGCGVDCSSMAELMMSRGSGFSGEEIMFSSNDTPAEEFAYARKLGAFINFDDLTLIDYYEKQVGDFPETMCCRFNPGGHFRIANKIMDNPGDAKYGFTKEQLFEGFRILKDRGVKHFGLHAFLASNTVSNDYYPLLSGQLFALARELKEELGVHIRFVNLSGGIGVPYKPEDEENDIFRIAEGVKEQYDAILKSTGMDDVEIYTEMGRFMLAPYGALITRAIHEKHIYKEYIGVDACAADLMRPAMYSAYHHITVLGKENNSADNIYDVTGSLCENNDKFAIDRKLPKIETGDLLFIHDTGAHGYSMGYNYNGRLRSAEVLLHPDGSFELIRRAENMHDYFATFDCFDVLKDMEYVQE